MLAFLFPVLGAALLLWGVGKVPRASRHALLLPAILIGYVLRLGLSFIAQAVPYMFMTASRGGDSDDYSDWAIIIAKLWRYTGVHYVTKDEVPFINDASLPPNVYAVIYYVNGEPTHLACVSLVAVLAGFTCIALYLIAIELGSTPAATIVIVAFIIITPSYLLYTSDMYKDGFVTFFVIGTLFCALRLSRKFSALHLVLGLLSVVGVYLTRYYLAYVVAVPLVLGAMGGRSKSTLRTAIVGLALVGILVTVMAYTNTLSNLEEGASHAIATGTSTAAMRSNAGGGSGVDLPTGPAALPLRLIYTLFSPFPWQSGSAGLHISKIETTIWYFLAVRAVIGARAVWRQDKSALMIILFFATPIALAYAASFANIGLVVRQRVAILMAMEVLAARSWAAGSSRLPKLAPLRARDWSRAT